jgi:hypothetical protein
MVEINNLDEPINFQEIFEFIKVNIIYILKAINLLKIS